MKRHKLTREQQKKLDECFLENKPVKPQAKKYRVVPNFKQLKDGLEKRQLRSFETIIQSGAFDIDQFTPKQTSSFTIPIYNL